MNLRYYSKAEDPQHGPYWYAVTDDGDYDGSGKDPLDAVCDLVRVMEKALDEQEDEKAPSVQEKPDPSKEWWEQ